MATEKSDKSTIVPLRIPRTTVLSVFCIPCMGYPIGDTSSSFLIVVFRILPMFYTNRPVRDRRSPYSSRTYAAAAAVRKRRPPTHGLDWPSKGSGYLRLRNVEDPEGDPIRSRQRSKFRSCPTSFNSPEATCQRSILRQGVGEGILILWWQGRTAHPNPLSVLIIWKVEVRGVDEERRMCKRGMREGTSRESRNGYLSQSSASIRARAGGIASIN